MSSRDPGTATGPGLLHELGGVIDREPLEAILRGFAELAGDDRSSARLREATGDELDLARKGHRTALLVWLRAWGCRHLRVADSGRSSRALAAWWRRHAPAMPEPGRALTDLVPEELEAAAEAYGGLASAPAAWREAPSAPVSVSFGETAAAKAMHAIRPLALPPWDAPIRAALGLAAGVDGYLAYLQGVAAAIRRLAARLRVPLDALPGALGRPGSTPPKLVDEFLWMRATRGLEARGQAARIARAAGRRTR